MSAFEKYGRPIAFMRIFTKITDGKTKVGVTGALMLSQAVYWSTRTKDNDGWFWKTADEWEEETGLTRREQETARKRLTKLGILEEKKMGVPCRMYFRIRESSLAHSVNLVSTNPPNWNGGMRQTITENTTKNTSENTDTPKPPGGLDPRHERIILIFQKSVKSTNRDKVEITAWKNNGSKVDEESLQLIERFYREPKSEKFDQTWQRKAAPAQLLNQWITQVELAEAFYEAGKEPVIDETNHGWD
jgi:hypothetical protein